MELQAVKIVGPGCSRCQETEMLVFNALAELNLDADVQEVRDRAGMVKLGVMFTPAVVVADEILVQGRIPRPEELKTWFRERAHESAGA